MAALKKRVIIMKYNTGKFKHVLSRDFPSLLKCLFLQKYYLESGMPVLADIYKRHYETLLSGEYKGPVDDQ